MADLRLPQKYNIKLEIIEMRKLILADGVSDAPAPYIFIKIGDITAQTQIKKGDSPTVDEKFDFTLYMYPDELKNLKILFQVYHKTVFYKSDLLIGTHSLDVWTVYVKATHMINKTWAILEHEESGNINTGYLKFSVICIAESDKMPGINYLFTKLLLEMTMRKKKLEERKMLKK